MKSSIYYLVYKEGKNPKTTWIGIKYPGEKPKPFVKIGGRRATETYRFLLQVFNSYGIKYSTVDKNNEYTVIKIPLPTGFAISIFLLSIYSTYNPIKYGFVFEKLLTGNMPLNSHALSFLDLAVDLSYYLDEKLPKKREQLLHPLAARTVSQVLLKLWNSLDIL